MSVAGFLEIPTRDIVVPKEVGVSVEIPDKQTGQAQVENDVEIDYLNCNKCIKILYM